MYNFSKENNEWTDSDHFSDLDVDSQAEITALPPSGDSDSESEVGENAEDFDEFPETPYVFSPEPEFGGVTN